MCVDLHCCLIQCVLWFSWYGTSRQMSKQWRRTFFYFMMISPIFCGWLVLISLVYALTYMCGIAGMMMTEQVMRWNCTVPWFPPQASQLFPRGPCNAPRSYPKSWISNLYGSYESHNWHDSVINWLSRNLEASVQTQAEMIDMWGKHNT